MSETKKTLGQIAYEASRANDYIEDVTTWEAWGDGTREEWEMAARAVVEASSTELATLRRRVAELEGENRDATEALRRALRQWKSYYESFGVELSQGVDDDLEPIATPKEDYDLETAKHPEGDLYRWCAKQLAILEARQPAPATEKQG